MTASPDLTLLEALSISARELATNATWLHIGLACSCTPLHLETFLVAYARELRPDAAIETLVGRYGDLAAGLDGLGTAPSLAACAAVVEWNDLDPRLGMRESVGAAVASVDDIVETAARRADRISHAVERLALRAPVVVSLPSLPMSPVYETGTWGEIDELRAGLDALIARFAGTLATNPQIRIIRVSGVGERDLAAETRAGFPYTSAGASAIAHGLSEALLRPIPKKGLITDLDDTLWRGLAGEDGAHGVSWELDDGAHVHALYQQFLGLLASEGVLVAAVSKNDPGVVAAVLERQDLLLSRDAIHPVVTSWKRKSDGVAEVLQAWNVDAADVIFVDDSPMELAEVASQFPGLTPLRFATGRPNDVLELMRTIRHLIPRWIRTAEDSLRADSVRRNADISRLRDAAPTFEEFLRDLSGSVTIDERGGSAPRALMLINKTNQFTLADKRFTAGSWQDMLARPGVIGCSVSYTDRFGPVGIISVLVGTRSGSRLVVDCWALSCRAFTRDIESHILLALLDRYDLDEAVVNIEETGRNHVVVGYLDDVGVRSDAGTVHVSRTDLERRVSSAIHTVNFADAKPGRTHR